MNYQDILENLKLRPHPEGGYFREDYRGPLTTFGIGSRKCVRPLFTTCYYLLGPGQQSALHKLQSDEVWFLLDGGPLEVFQIFSDGSHQHITLGTNLSEGHQLKHHVAAGTWFGARLCPGADHALLNCMVCPGFEFQDWELADSSILSVTHPDLKDIINTLSNSLPALFPKEGRQYE